MGRSVGPSDPMYVHRSGRSVGRPRPQFFAALRAARHQGRGARQDHRPTRGNAERMGRSVGRPRPQFFAALRAAEVGRSADPGSDSRPQLGLGRSVGDVNYTFNFAPPYRPVEQQNDPVYVARCTSIWDINVEKHGAGPGVAVRLRLGSDGTRPSSPIMTLHLTAVEDRNPPDTGREHELSCQRRARL